MNRFLKQKKHLNGYSWTVSMITSIITMFLSMWNNQCYRLHDCSNEENIQKKKDIFLPEINIFSIDIKLLYVDLGLFWLDPLTMTKTKTVEYTIEWPNTFYPAGPGKEFCPTDIGLKSIPLYSDSEGSLSTRDLDEYLVDVNNGMDMN